MEKTCEISFLTDVYTIKATIGLIKQVYTACFGYDTLPQVIEVLPEEGCTTKGVFLACKASVPYVMYTPWGVLRPFRNVERRVRTCEQIGALRVPSFEHVYKNLKVILNEHYGVLLSVTNNLTMSIFKPTEYSVYRDIWEELLKVYN